MIEYTVYGTETYEKQKNALRHNMHSILPLALGEEVGYRMAIKGT